MVEATTSAPLLLLRGNLPPLLQLTAIGAHHLLLPLMMSIVSWPELFVTSVFCATGGSVRPLAADVVVSLHVTEGCGLIACLVSQVGEPPGYILGFRLVLDDCINVSTFVCGMTVFMTHTAHQVAVAAISLHVSHVQAIGLMVTDVTHSPGHGELFDVNA